MALTNPQTLDQMKHPDDKCNQSQSKFLDALTGEERLWHERMFRIGNATFVYHSKTNDEEYSPTYEDFLDWLDGLPSNIRKAMEEKGFEGCKTALPFTRHVMERNDIGLDEWLKAHLSNDDFEWWNSTNKDLSE